MKLRSLLAIPVVLLAQCAPTCAPAPPAPGGAIAVPALGSGTTPYRLPVADATAAGWGTTHAEYTATDIFLRCGARLVSPVNGVVVESRRVDAFDPNVDDPATRGGRSVAIVGDDGVRYYLAHFEQIDDGIEPGVRVEIGQSLGLMGMTGRASACHVHFALSPPCPGPEWSVRRGVIWPYPYLDDWRAGGQRSPVAEIQQWVADHPDGCALAMADPYAGHA
ncbi:MAG: M23 family metallopeptidase [Ilumatobacteraceae bacterium]